MAMEGMEGWRTGRARETSHTDPTTTTNKICGCGGGGAVVVGGARN